VAGQCRRRPLGQGGCVADAEPALVVVRTFHDVAVSCLSTGLEW
jgi:hypothetical protein